MLYEIEAKNISFLEQFTSLKTNFAENEIELLNTILDDQFPGAILPSDECYYIVASLQKDWNVLSTLVKSFIGLSYSDFNGIRKTYDRPTVLESFILKQDLLFISEVLLPENLVIKEKVTAEFIKLYNLYKISPNKQLQTFEYIDSILENFKQALYLQDNKTAEKILLQIKSESRLDALNLKFMEIEIFHSAHNWEGIINDDFITHIINSRKPLRIRLHIIEAFFYVYISTQLDKDDLINIYKNEIRSSILSLLFSCPANATDAVKSIFLLAYLHNDIAISDIEKIKLFIETNQFLTHDLKNKLKDKISLDIDTYSQEERTRSSYLMARASIINANNTDTIESIETAQVNLEVLQEREQVNLKNESIHLGIYNGNFELPSNWIEWLNCLSHELFKNSSSIAEYALEEWSIDSFTNDPTSVSLICKAIMSLDKDFSIQRFIYSLPLFVESFKRSSHYPNPMLLQMYISILEIITVYEIQDQSTLIISQDIVETLLQISPNNVQYVHILSMVDDIVEKTNGKKYINWLLDYAELLISENSVDMRIRDKTLENLLTKIYDQKQWIEEYQLQLVLKLASLIGIQELFNEMDTIHHESVGNVWENFKNKTIGIYTLSENAGRHAKEYFEENIENVKVLLNHDKSATESLRHLAYTSDYLILVTQAAKHAATAEIQKILRLKGTDPLFPIGKGSSSIISSLLGVV